MVRARGIDVHRWAVDALFESGTAAHVHRPLSFSPHNEVRVPPLREPRGRRVVVPLHASPASPHVDLSEFVDGARRLGFVPSPQQERFARIACDVVELDDGDLVPRYRRIAETMPRRSGKTDGQWALMVGRCATRDDYHVAFSAQTGAKGRKRFLDFASRLERWDPCPRGRGDDPGCTRTDHVHYRVYRSNGGESILWESGSSIHVLPPDPENYRSDEYALVILDEGQEITDEEQANELLGGVLPTMDTVPDAQLIVGGTAGKFRRGLLWTALEKGRAGSWGILEYAAPEHADPTDPATWEATHPGIGTLTTLDVIAERFDDNSLLDFQREYLGQWPVDPTASAIDLTAWGKAASEPTLRPKRVAIAYDVAIDDSCAALACAWRDDDGRPHVELLAFRAGVSWLAAEAYRVARSAGVPIAYDNIGKNLPTATTLHHKRPVPRLQPMSLKDVQGAAQRIVSEVVDGRLVHFDQKDLNLAVEGAAWRPAGENGRAFGHKASAHPIVPLTACALALWSLDSRPARRRARPQVTAA